MRNSYTSLECKQHLTDSGMLSKRAGAAWENLNPKTLHRRRERDDFIHCCFLYSRRDGGVVPDNKAQRIMSAYNVR